MLLSAALPAGPPDVAGVAGVDGRAVNHGSGDAADAEHTG